MSFRWSEYLDLAQELIGDQGVIGSEEAKLRAAISRAYYAAHRTAMQVAQSTDLFAPAWRPGVGVHIELINFLLFSRKPGRRAVARRLDQLRRLRVAADYQDQIPLATLRTDGRLAIRLAQRILTSLASFR